MELEAPTNVESMDYTGYITEYYSIKNIHGTGEGKRGGRGRRDILVKRMLTINQLRFSRFNGAGYSLRKSALHPRSRKTPTGCMVSRRGVDGKDERTGRKMARMILMISLQAIR